MRIVTFVVYWFCDHAFWISEPHSTCLVSGGIVSRLWHWIWSLPVVKQGWR